MNQILILATSLLFVSTRSTGFVQNPPAEVMRIGLRKQLMVDDYVIAKRSQVTHVLGKPLRGNEGKSVLVGDRPWEVKNQVGAYLTVLHEDGKCRLWYRPFEGAFAYAESKDGIHWEKPNLGLYNFRSSTCGPGGSKGTLPV